MESDIFRSGVNMAHKDILEHIVKTSKSSSIEAFKLKPDVTEVLENMIFHKKHARCEVYLDSNFILAPNNSGGGANGSGHR